MNLNPSIPGYEKFEFGLEMLSRLAKRSTPARHTLRSVLEEIEPLPRYSVVIGACDDGLPVLMDLSNPRAGSILIIADPCSGKTALLSSILSSACTTNPARSLRVSLISSRPEQLGMIAKLPHAYQASSPEETLLEMASIVENRTGEFRGPAILLAIDNLPDLLEKLDPGLVEKLIWLIKHGPSVQVRVIATAESEKLPILGEPMIDSFGAWLVGKMENPQVGTNLALIPEEKSRSLKPGSQFCVYYENDWVPFWVLC
jgi:hypothetical protein